MWCGATLSSAVLFSGRLPADSNLHLLQREQRAGALALARAVHGHVAKALEDLCLDPAVPGFDLPDLFPGQPCGFRL